MINQRQKNAISQSTNKIGGTSKLKSNKPMERFRKLSNGEKQTELTIP